MELEKLIEQKTECFTGSGAYCFDYITPENCKTIVEEHLINYIEVDDIRNKLSPITHLISMLEANEIQNAMDALEQAKKSINYLAKREVYKQ